MSKNWLIASIRYDLKPTLDNYIRSRFAHFKFCARKNSMIDASTYLDNLSGEIQKQLNDFKGTNKHTLILTVVQKALTNKGSLEEMVSLFEKTEIGEKDIHAAFGKVNEKLQDNIKDSEISRTNIASRTYLIGTHIYLELENREADYDALVRNKKELTTFIAEKFGTAKLSPRIADMKNFSYKKILQGRNNDGAKGQLRPQLKQIIDNPGVFGPEISMFAANLMKEFFDESL